MGCSSSKEFPSNGQPRVIQKRNGGGDSARIPDGHDNPFVLPAGQHGNPPAMRTQNNGTVPTEQHSESCHAAHNAFVIQQGKGERFSSGAWPKVLQGQGLIFTVYVHYHEITFPPKNLPCWTYISQGFSQNNQPDVVFTVLRRPNESEEDFPEAPVEWMKLVYAMAGSGLNLETGQMCDLVFENNLAFIKLNNFIFPQNVNKWMSMRGFGGIVHGISDQCSLTGIPGAIIPHDFHRVIALTHEEAAVAREFGVTRVIGHIGLAVRWFPHPPFIDRDRGDCVDMADQAGSIRTTLPIARIYGFKGMVINDEIVFTIPGGEGKRNMFRKHVQDTPLSAAMAFECFMSQEADSGFLWKTGQTNPIVYGGNW